MSRQMISSSIRGALALLGALGASCAFNGCLIEERVVDEDCFAYCENVQSQCTGNYTVYLDTDSCMAACRQMPRAPEGVDPVTSGNTLDCRVARMAVEFGFDVANCLDVGPGGNGQCGADCDTLCSLRREACGGIEPEELDIADADYCLRSCRGLPGSDALDTMSVAANEDSVLCRLKYLSAALAGGDAARENCPHTRIDAPAGSACPDEFVPADECAVYCADVKSNCQAGFQVYDSDSQCQQVCKTFVAGARMDTQENTIRCREYHARAAAGSPGAAQMHCVHAGPTGDGHCGGPEGNCDSYCKILAQACPAGFEARYGDHLACADACALLPEAGMTDALRDAEVRYSVVNEDQIDAQPTPTLACRVLHAVRAMEAPNDPEECARALAEPGSLCE